MTADFRDSIIQLANAQARQLCASQGYVSASYVFICPGELALSDLTTYANPELLAWLKSNHPELFV